MSEVVQLELGELCCAGLSSQTNNHHLAKLAKDLLGFLMFLPPHRGMERDMRLPWASCCSLPPVSACGLEKGPENITQGSLQAVGGGREFHLCDYGKTIIPPG